MPEAPPDRRQACPGWNPSPRCGPGSSTSPTAKPAPPTATPCCCCTASLRRPQLRGRHPAAGRRGPAGAGALSQRARTDTVPGPVHTTIRSAGGDRHRRHRPHGRARHPLRHPRRLRLGGRAACVAAALWPERCAGLVRQQLPHPRHQHRHHPPPTRAGGRVLVLLLLRHRTRPARAHAQPARHRQGDLDPATPPTGNSTKRCWTAPPAPSTTPTTSTSSSTPTATDSASPPGTPLRRPRRPGRRPAPHHRAHHHPGRPGRWELPGNRRHRPRGTGCRRPCRPSRAAGRRRGLSSLRLIPGG